MIERKGCFVIDRLENIGQYASLSANFAKACAFVAQGGFDKLAKGKNVIDGDQVFVNRDDAHYVLPTERRPELHRAYFDIQIPLETTEKFGLAAYDPEAKGTFNEEKDFGLYEQPVEWFTVCPGEFVICWPKTCVHAPAVTPDEPKTAAKLVIKVHV